jgi:hypothetical protein
MGDLQEDLEESRKAARAVLDAMKAETEAFKKYEEALGKFNSKCLQYYLAHRDHLDPAAMEAFVKPEQTAAAKAESDYESARKATRDAVDIFVKAEKHVVWHLGHLGLPWPH